MHKGSLTRAVIKNEGGYNRRAQVGEPVEFEESANHETMPERECAQNGQLERAHLGRGENLLD